MSHKIAVLGAGSWGTALAINLSSKGCKVSMWILILNIYLHERA